MQIDARSWDRSSEALTGQLRCSAGSCEQPTPWTQSSNGLVRRRAVHPVTAYGDPLRGKAMRRGNPFPAHHHQCPTERGVTDMPAAAGGADNGVADSQAEA